MKFFIRWHGPTLVKSEDCCCSNAVSSYKQPLSQIPFQKTLPHCLNLRLMMQSRESWLHKAVLEVLEHLNSFENRTASCRVQQSHQRRYTHRHTSPHGILKQSKRVWLAKNMRPPAANAPAPHVCEKCCPELPLNDKLMPLARLKASVLACFQKIFNGSCRRTTYENTHFQSWDAAKRCRLDSIGASKSCKCLQKHLQI